MNRKTGVGKLYLQMSEDVRVYYHAPENVPYINSDSGHRKDVILGESHEVLLNVIEIENDENVRKVAIAQRNCRFPWENPDNIKVHSVYSYSSCVVQCHVESHFRYCNCTHHLMPTYNILNRIRAPRYSKAGLTCNCLPSCVEPEIKIISERKRVGPALGEIEIKIQSLPTSRFKRIVVRSTMDLVVSIGGTIGLFLGASLLSLVDLLYLMFLRKM